MQITNISQKNLTDTEQRFRKTNSEGENTKTSKKREDTGAKSQMRRDMQDIDEVPGARAEIRGDWGRKSNGKCKKSRWIEQAEGVGNAEPGKVRVWRGELSQNWRFSGGVISGIPEMGHQREPVGRGRGREFEVWGGKREWKWCLRFACLLWAHPIP